MATFYTIKGTVQTSDTFYNIKLQPINLKVNLKIQFEMRNEQQAQSLQKISRVDTQQQISQQQGQISKTNLMSIKKAKQRLGVPTHVQLMRDHLFRSSFTIKQRAGNWFYNCFRCLDSQSTYISILDQQQKKHSASLTDDMRRELKDKILKLKIIESSRLQLDPNVMHPFVKVHIVDKNTGQYLKGPQDKQNFIYTKEQITYINEEKKFETCENNILLPFATNCCEFRQLGDSRGVWNQKFYIDTKAEEVMSPNTVILFQILDFNHQALIYKDTDIYDKDNFYRVAWGFLRPVGISKTHLGKTKIQLFKYKFQNKKLDSSYKSSYVPSVYYDFLWNSHEKYEGFLTVQLISTLRPNHQQCAGDHIPKTIFESQKTNKEYVQKFISAEDRKNQEEQSQIKQQLLKFYRNKNHCQIPKDMIYKFQSSRLGCFRVKFVGNYLFAACSKKNTTSIKVFNLQNGQKVMTMKGHRQIIYELTTNSNPADGKQTYLITAGSDHFVRIWKIPQNYGQYIDQDESQQYLAGQCLHTAAVYSASALLINLKDILYTVTCCYDGYIRLWESPLPQAGERKYNSSKIVNQILINYNQRTGQRVYPTCSVISSSNQVYIGQSGGNIRIFNFESGKLTFQNVVTNSQLSRDAILSIQIVQRHLFIQSSDNMIRRFQLSGTRLHEDKKYAGGQYENLLVNCKISPDFKYLLAPSQSGKPVMWDVFTGITIDLQYLNLSIKGPLTCCDWHPKYNLVVVGGFVEDCPIFVFGNTLTQNQMKIVLTD